MKQKRYGYFFRNIALFTVSSFVSKLLVFLLVPFYTSVLTESEYGVADVVQSTLLLLIPLLSLNAGEAALRFCLEEGADILSVFRAGIRRLLAADALVAAACSAAAFFINAAGISADTGTDVRLQLLILIFIPVFAADSFYEFMLLFCQGAEQVRIMVCGSVSCTLLVICANLVCLLGLRLGLMGYLISQVAAFSGAGIIMTLLCRRAGIFQASASGTPDTDTGRQMEEYGRGMLVYSTSSWANNALDRYFILGMLGSAANGLYGAAYKIPAILQVFQRIFAQAWQMSAVKEYQGEDREEFFSRMYRIYNAALVMVCAFILLFLELIASIMFRKGFYEAWVLVPPLLISVVFGALEGFIGSICLAFKDGRSMGRATLIGALVNAALNFALIRVFGSMGAAAATLFSYFTMFILSFIFLKKHVTLKVSLRRDFISYLLLIAESLFLIYRVRGHFLINLGICVLAGIMNLKELVSIAEDALKKTGIAAPWRSGIFSAMKGRAGQVMRNIGEGASEWLVVLLFIWMIFSTFISQSFYAVTTRYATLITALVLSAVLILKKPWRRWEMEGWVEASCLALAVVIAAFNLFYLGSNKGAVLVVFDLVLIFTVYEELRFNERQLRLISLAGCILMLPWYAVVRWDYGFNMAGLCFMILMIFGELFLNYVRYDLELDYIKYIQVLLFAVTLLFEVCYHARSAAVGAALFGVIWLLLPLMEGMRILRWLLAASVTYGSIVFTIIYTTFAGLGINMTILYKELLSGRELIWGELLEQTALHPFTGVGSSYELKNFFMLEVHNGFLDIMAIHGIPVFLILSTVMFRRLVKKGGVKYAWYPDRRLAMAGIYALAFASFFENGFIVPPYSVVFLALLSI